jgi:hypothetical protein
LRSLIRLASILAASTIAFSRELAMAQLRLHTDCNGRLGVNSSPHCRQTFGRFLPIIAGCIARLEVFRVIVQGIRYSLYRHRYPLKGG